MDGDNLLSMSNLNSGEEGTAADGSLTSRVKPRLARTATPTDFVADVTRMEDSSSRHFSSSMEISPGSASASSSNRRRRSTNTNDRRQPEEYDDRASRDGATTGVRSGIDAAASYDSERPPPVLTRKPISTRTLLKVPSDSSSEELSSFRQSRRDCMKQSQSRQGPPGQEEMENIDGIVLDTDTKREIVEWALQVAKSGIFQADCPTVETVKSLFRALSLSRISSPVSTTERPTETEQTPTKNSYHREGKSHEYTYSTPVKMSPSVTKRPGVRHRSSSRERVNSYSSSDNEELQQITPKRKQPGVLYDSNLHQKQYPHRNGNISYNLSSTSDSTDYDSRGSRFVNFEDEDMGRRNKKRGVSRRRGDFIRLDRYDGSTSLEAFLAHFDNCARYNQWTYNDKLSQLKAALKGSAAEILLESERIMSYRELRNELRECFGTDGLENQLESQLKTRRRQKGETLRVLYQDINRLVLQAYPGQHGRIRDKIAVEAFITSLNDPELELNVRNSGTNNLRQCFHAAMKYESNRTLVRRTDLSRERRQEGRFDMQARVVSYNDTWQDTDDSGKQFRDAYIIPKTELNNNSVEDELLNRVAQLEEQVRQLQTSQTARSPNNRFNSFHSNKVNMHNTESKLPINQNVSNHTVPVNNSWQQSNLNQFPVAMVSPPNDSGYYSRPRQPVVCYFCGLVGHKKSECPSRPRFAKGSCYECGSTEHYRNLCPLLNRQNGNYVNANMVKIRTAKHHQTYWNDTSNYKEKYFQRGIQCRRVCVTEGDIERSLRFNKATIPTVKVISPGVIYSIPEAHKIQVEDKTAKSSHSYCKDNTGYKSSIPWNDFEASSKDRATPKLNESVITSRNSTVDNNFVKPISDRMGVTGKSVVFTTERNKSSKERGFSVIVPMTKRYREGLVNDNKTSYFCGKVNRSLQWNGFANN